MEKETEELRKRCYHCLRNCGEKQIFYRRETRKERVDMRGGLEERQKNGKLEGTQNPEKNMKTNERNRKDP